MLIRVIFTGGLGNQLFEYAFMIVLRERYFEVEARTDDSCNLLFGFFSNKVYYRVK